MMRRVEGSGSAAAGTAVWAVSLVLLAGGLAVLGARPGPGGVPYKAPGGAPERVIDFNRDVRPILADRCFPCHGPDEAANAKTGGLRLDSFDGATRDLAWGGRAIDPGSPETSELLRRLRSADPLERMPPPESNLTVAEEEVAILETWIAQGAGYAEHWSFVAPRDWSPPKAGEGWARTGIDRFIAAKLESAGLTPSPEADRETLIRRVTLDLTGLPPTPGEIDAFLADDEPGAYERVVDRLLASRHYGERMALMWLDVARYADTHGYHHDNTRSQWPWRDWVISAFNDNKPYDEFIIEQLAGDLLADATDETRLATAFSRNHPMTDEGGAIDAEYLVEYAADRVETTSTAFLGATMSCVRCHDHKFDPFTMEDYYGLFAFFNSVEERGLNDMPQGKVDRAFPPFMPVPDDAQAESLARLAGVLEELRSEAASHDVTEELTAWTAAIRERSGVLWRGADLVSAESLHSDGDMDGQPAPSILTITDEKTVLASGPQPDREHYELTYRLGHDAANLSVIRLDALTHESIEGGGPGRADHRNVVLTGFEVEVGPEVADNTGRRRIPVSFAWAGHEQQNGDFGVLRALDESAPSGWAFDSGQPGGRTALFFADEPFGEPGDLVTVRLRFESPYAKHSLGHLRLSFGSAGDRVRGIVPVVWRDWFLAGPFPGKSANDAFARVYGPEADARIVGTQKFGESGKPWVHKPELEDGRVNPLSGERSAFYLGRQVISPTARNVEVSLGSDDAIRVFLNGRELLASNVRRGAAPDQDLVTLPLEPGENSLVLKIVNDGGPAGFYFRVRDPDALPGALDPLALVDEPLLAAGEADRLTESFKLRSPAYRALVDRIGKAEREFADVRRGVPNVMVLKELPEPRATFVLARGAYDHPDESRPVQRAVPAILGSLPDDAPRDRLGLARWLVSDENPLTARVAVNRFWHMIFGAGLVRTLGDFGTQGEWPSHPQLLDHLARQFQRSGWDVKALIRAVVTSSTYRQSSKRTALSAEIDPENRLLSYFPRRRLPAEAIRDVALHASGLLNGRIGGPPVRPYQPAGLWREIAMLNSDTRIFQRDDGDELYRRGMYTFWKRAAPPPQMVTFDAPEREFCVVKRSATNTPLQALVLMNDETYLEIARKLAQRAMLETGAPDDLDPEAAIERAFRLMTGRRPAPEELGVLTALYHDALATYGADPQAAVALLSYGESPRADDLPISTHAAMTAVASAIINLDETITRD